MKKRITISLDSDLGEKVKHFQAELMLDSNRTISFSEALNQILREAMMKKDSLKISAELNTKFGR